MRDFNLLESIDLERERRLKGRVAVDPNADLLWTKALNLVSSSTEKERLLEAYQFAGNIKYDHAGLSPEIYFAHPIRVASLAMLYYDKMNVDLGIVGLIHNVFELSDYTNDFITEKFGKKISNQILDLTVDREQQWDEDYKNTYYKKIENGPIEARVIKIIDKLDNLFILGVNPNEEIKIKYLKEIEKHVLPLAYRTTPKIYSYMKELVDDNYKSGFNIG
tara:strand:+ start:1906 stop:2565 length:660 start_codon:yes stop_codon:yes gene_type:complete